MKKGLVIVSVVASIVLFSGCGGGSSGGDTTAPKFNFTKYSFDTPENKVMTVDLKDGIKDDDTKIVYTISSQDGNDASIAGSKLQYSAGSYAEGTAPYKVKVIATDSAKNASAPQVFVFNVKKDLAQGGYGVKSSYIASTGGDKDFTDDGGYLKDPSGLLWDDRVSKVMDYAAASSYCENDWRLPTRSEFLNIMDYDKGNTAGTQSLIDGSFTNFKNDNYDGSWVKKTGTERFVVNHKSGADTQKDIDIPQRVMCVYGSEADAHSFDITGADTVKDLTTKLEWKKIKNTVASGSNITYGNFSKAKDVCTGAWKLPTINQLRSIVRYSNNTIAVGTPVGLTSTNYYIWSSTEYKNGPKEAYYTIHLDGDSSKSGIVSEFTDDNITHYVTCVKEL